MDFSCLGAGIQVASLNYCRVNLGFRRPLSYALKPHSTLSDEGTSTDQGGKEEKSALTFGYQITKQSFRYSTHKPTSAEEEDQWI